MGGAAMMTGVPLGELAALVQVNVDGVLGCIDSRAMLPSRACPVDGGGCSVMGLLGYFFRSANLRKPRAGLLGSNASQLGEASLRGQNEATKSDRGMAERTVYRGVDLSCRY